MIAAARANASRRTPLRSTTPGSNGASARQTIGSAGRMYTSRLPALRLKNSTTSSHPAEQQGSRQSRRAAPPRVAPTAHGSASNVGSHCVAHDREEVPGRLPVVPGLGVALGGLPEQDVVDVGAATRVAAMRDASTASARATAATGSRNGSGPSHVDARRQPIAPTPRQPRACASAAGSSTSSAITPTPLVITPSPAANQPSHHMRRSGPRSRWRSRPYMASVIQNTSSGSICAVAPGR